VRRAKLESIPGHSLGPGPGVLTHCRGGLHGRPLPAERAWGQKERRQGGSARAGSPKTAGFGDRRWLARFRGTLRARLPVLHCPPFALQYLSRRSIGRSVCKRRDSSCRGGVPALAGSPPFSRRCARRGESPRAGVGGEERSRPRTVGAGGSTLLDKEADRPRSTCRAPLKLSSLGSS
jgi:hypothetical protein